MRALMISLALASVACGPKPKPMMPAPPPTPPRAVAPAPGFSPNPPPSFADPATGQMVSGPGVAGPRATYAPNAAYTDAARTDRITGVVVLSVVVDATGRVESVDVTKSLREDLDAKAVATMKTWRFDPAHNDGKAVAAKINVEMSFNLQ